MRLRFVRLDEAIRWLFYVDERLTMRELGTRLGCGVTTISRRLHRFKIPARPRGPAPLRDASGFAWPPVAYAIGLIATDGNLSRDGRHMSVVSKDVDLLETLRRCLTLRVAISECQSDGDRSVSLASASRPFIDWVQASVQRLTSLNGVIEAQHG